MRITGPLEIIPHPPASILLCALPPLTQPGLECGFGKRSIVAGFCQMKNGHLSAERLCSEHGDDQQRRHPPKNLLEDEGAKACDICNGMKGWNDPITNVAGGMEEGNEQKASSGVVENPRQQDGEGEDIEEVPECEWK